MSEKRTIDVKQYVDNQPFSRFHWLVLVLCFLVVALDGYDTAAIGYVAGSISQDWNIARAALGPVMSAALIGLGLGAFVGGPLADRFGRKTVITGAVFFFGLFTLLSATATSLNVLTVFRLLTGLGLGAAMPNSVALMSEFAPARVRSVTVNSQLVGFSAGLAAAGALSAWLIPKFGWQSVFIVGGIAPLVLAVILIAFLPESPQYLVLRKRSDTTIANVLRRISPSADLGGCTFAIDAREAGTQQSHRWLILSPEYRVGTLVLWTIYFMNLLVFYLLTGWLPTLFRDAGFSLERAALVSSIFPIGGILGAIVVGYIMDHFNGKRVVGLIYLLVAVMAVVIGQSLKLPFMLGALMFLTGALITSASTSLATIAAQYYSADCRATGVSWMFTFGRFGAVFGTFAGATLTAMGWRFGSVFALLAIPALIASGGLFLLARITSSKSSGKMGNLVVNAAARKVD